MQVSKWERSIYRFFIFWYICGVILLTFDLLPPWLEWANVVFLITSGSLGAIYLIKNYYRIGIAAALFIFFVSMAAEHFGVKYGILFGDYYYNAYFGPKLFEVPITIGFAWIMVIATSHVMAVRIFPNSSILIKSLTAAGATVILDLIIDPVSFIAKEYWIWTGESFYYDIPLYNFFSWFALALVFHLLLFHFTKGMVSNENTYWEKNMYVLYGLMIAMFCVIALSVNLFLAFFATIVPTLLLYIGTFKHKEFFNDSSKKKQSI
ncbi:carotenoid biosynthesis protein [Sutcliffiella deserti]|uniref:carotenoid biosynthesis protein n=1 Tax=Sutcliffiella deserti TaxID=2875501 RepID=UPI001CBE6A79|nr:carotenoid biosynthesis protein [Sutcliffiella deserti]